MLNLIGLALRAKKITIGSELTIKGVRNGKVRLVFLANDAAVNTTKLVTDKCHTFNVEVISDFNGIELSNSVGKNNIKVIGITDQGFSEALSRKRKWIIWPKIKMLKNKQKVLKR